MTGEELDADEDKGAEVDDELVADNTAGRINVFLYAILKNSLRCAQALIDHRADVNCHDGQVGFFVGTFS